MKIKNHYDWLDANLDTFWVRVFGKGLSESSCGGIISCHGDKGYGYRSDWEEAGIHFYHGMALFMLTYTNELGDTPKWKSKEWVIENYPKYKDLLPAIEDGN